MQIMISRNASLYSNHEPALPVLDLKNLNQIIMHSYAFYPPQSGSMTFFCPLLYQIRSLQVKVNHIQVSSIKVNWEMSVNLLVGPSVSWSIHCPCHMLLMKKLSFFPFSSSFLLFSHIFPCLPAYKASPCLQSRIARLHTLSCPAPCLQLHLYKIFPNFPKIFHE